MNLNELRLPDEEILSAFDADFGAIYFDHKPTAEDMLLIKLKLVEKAVLLKLLKDERVLILAEGCREATISKEGLIKELEK